MPIYEYRCSVCGERFEKLVRSSSGQAEIRCPNCDGDKVDRLVSRFGFSSGGGDALYNSSSSCGPTTGG